MATVKEMFWEARAPPTNPRHLSFQDKAVLVTGANSGLGYQTAVKYAALGASPLILAVRSDEKGQAAKAAIVRETRCAAEIIVITVDLSTFASVKEFASRLDRQVSRLPVVSLCAGVARPLYSVSPEGYEMSTQVNVLSNALLGLLLLPKLHEAAATASGDGFRPHLCFLNSLASNLVGPESVPPGESFLQRLNDSSRFDTTAQYYLVKLAAFFVMRGLIDRSREYGDGAEVVINACCPSMCRTNMQRDMPFVSRVTMRMLLLFVGRSAEEGSRTLVSATGLGPKSTGRMWRDVNTFRMPSDFLVSEHCNELYRETWGEIWSVLKDYLEPGDA